VRGCKCRKEWEVVINLRGKLPILIFFGLKKVLAKMQKQQIGPYDQKNNMFKIERYNLERQLENNLKREIENLDKGTGSREFFFRLFSFITFPRASSIFFISNNSFVV
jgi:hypothetical protein